MSSNDVARGPAVSESTAGTHVPADPAGRNGGAAAAAPHLHDWQQQPVHPTRRASRGAGYIPPRDAAERAAGSSDVPDDQPGGSIQGLERPALLSNADGASTPAAPAQRVEHAKGNACRTGKREVQSRRSLRGVHSVNGAAFSREKRAKTSEAATASGESLDACASVGPVLEPERCLPTGTVHSAAPSEPYHNGILPLSSAVPRSDPTLPPTETLHDSGQPAWSPWFHEDKKGKGRAVDLDGSMVVDQEMESVHPAPEIAGLLDTRLRGESGARPDVETNEPSSGAGPGSDVPLSSSVNHGAKHSNEPASILPRDMAERRPSFKNFTTTKRTGDRGSEAGVDLMYDDSVVTQSESLPTQRNGRQGVSLDVVVEPVEPVSSRLRSRTSRTVKPAPSPSVSLSGDVPQLSGPIQASKTGGIPPQRRPKRRSTSVGSGGATKKARASTRNTNEEASESDFNPRAPLVCSSLRAQSHWRIVVSPSSRQDHVKELSGSYCYPRVWAGKKDELYAAFPAISKNHGGVAWDGLEHPILLFTGKKEDAGLGWSGENTWEGRRIVFSIVRETNVSLATLRERDPAATAREAALEAKSVTTGAHLPGEPLPTPPVPIVDGFGEPPADQSLVPQDPATTHRSPALHERKASFVISENSTSAASLLTCAAPLTNLGHGHGPSYLLSDLQFDRGGRVVPRDGLVSSPRQTVNEGYHELDPAFERPTNATYAIGNPQTASKLNDVSVETTPVYDHAPADDLLAPVRIDLGTAAPDAFSILDPHHPFPGVRGASPPCIMLSPTHVPDPPTSPTPHARSPKALSAEIAHPSSPELARPNSIYPPSQPVSQPNANDGHAMADPFGEEGLQDPHLPEPPTEVAALLMSHQTGDVVSPVFARNSPLAQWQLPPEIEYFWAGLFEITDVKVETSVKPRMQNTATVRRTWRFALQWVPGGEDLLRDDGQDGYKEWLEHIMRPWWEVEAVLRLDQLPSERSQDASMLTPNNEAIMTQGHFGRSRLLLPLPLLAPFTATSTASGNFPAGYYCMQCGRINVQRFLRHRDCGNASCTSRSDSHKPTSWVVSAFSTRDRKINTATFFPDDKWAAPVTASRTRQFEDGMSLHHYKLGTKLLANDPSSAVADSDVSDTDEKMPSVFHIFNGNAPRLQERPSELFETFQREIRFEREPGATCFSASHGPSKDATTCSVWDQQTEYIESALKQYCPNLSNLKVDGLLIRAWNSDGKDRQTFRPTATCLVLLCLGADIALYSIASGTGAKSKAKATKEALRVTMVHGDVVVLKGPRFEFSMVRTGMCMLVEAQCI